MGTENNYIKNITDEQLKAMTLTLYSVYAGDKVKALQHLNNNLWRYLTSDEYDKLERLIKSSF